TSIVPILEESGHWTGRLVSSFTWAAEQEPRPWPAEALIAIPLGKVILARFSSAWEIASGSGLPSSSLPSRPLVGIVSLTSRPVGESAWLDVGSSSFISGSNLTLSQPVISGLANSEVFQLESLYSGRPSAPRAPGCSQESMWAFAT